ncbi:MAG: endonuclease/exonuclease/phosphatase family protein [Gemmatimonadales bacterium]|nr:endonuclease/exonuclease/phosphatase family protein [Gemmatimonadales bacterium]
MLRLFLLLLLALPALPLPAQAPVRVVSFNIRYGTANDGAHAWPARRAHVIATIRDHAPHLLGVQEALRFQLDELRAALPGYQEIGVGRDDGSTAGEYAALLIDTLRFGVVASGTFWLSDTPEVPGSMHWGNRITRVTTWARIVDRSTDDTIRVYNLHWDHESQPSRVRSAQLLKQRIATDAMPGDAIIVMGDFNSDESNPAFTMLVSEPTVPLHDTFRALHPDARVVGTFNSFRGDSTAGKIDAVLVGQGWETIDAGIDRRRFGALWASDHFAVWAAIRRRP